MPRLALILLLALPPLASAQDAPSLRTQLETAYSQWRTAMLDKDLAAWTDATAAPRRAMTRNTIVSQRQPFPQALFDLPISPPALYHLRFIKAEEENGTAAAIYFGKADFGITPPGEELPENLLILRFMNEDGRWKFDRTRFINLGPTPDIREKIAAGDRAFLGDPVFRPAGAIPPVPASFPVPDHVATVEIVAIGYETRLRINDTHESLVADDTVADLVLGGLANGKNALTVETSPIEPEAGATGPAERKFEISVYVIRDAERKPPARVYHYAPETVPATHTASVYANAVTIKD